jgi:hypothetical protein
MPVSEVTEHKDSEFADVQDPGTHRGTNKRG